MSSKSGWSLSSRVRPLRPAAADGFASDFAAPFGARPVLVAFVFVVFGAGLADCSAAVVAFNAFFVVVAVLAVAAFAALPALAARAEAVVVAAVEEAFCDALLRRSARADPEDFTMVSLKLAGDESVDRGDCQLHEPRQGPGSLLRVQPGAGEGAHLTQLRAQLRGTSMDAARSA